MNERRRQTRINQALQVIKRTEEGLSICAACRESGLARSTFYFIISEESDAVAEFQAMVKANAREQLAMILANKQRVLERVIDQGLAEDTSPRDRLAILRELNKMTDELAEKIRISTQAQSDLGAREILGDGPVLRPGKSRFISFSEDTRNGE